MHQLSPASAVEADIEREQSRLNRLYAELDARRGEMAETAAAALGAPTGTAQARLERESKLRELSQKAARYDSAENGLCFGRVDLEDGDQLYIGRIGLLSEDLDEPPLLIDWRAPAARVFYTATAAAPNGVTFRRHLHTQGRRVLRVDDELFGEADTPPDVQLSGEAALLASLRAERSGRMRDIVATLQAEQDRIIRSPREGVLVVQGGPGTGKTVVALHRAAYLLYTHPRIARRGVLVVGPNPVFVNYTSQVLPGLGETNVLMATIGAILPGVVVTRSEPDETAAVKGRLTMAEAVAEAVRLRQAAVDKPVSTLIGGELIELSVEFLTDAADRARETRLPHNPARPVFCDAVINEIARRLSHFITDIEARFDEELAEQIDHDRLAREAAADIASVFGEGTGMVDLEEQKTRDIAASKDHWLAALPEDPAVQRLLDRLWPELTPAQLLEELYHDARFLRSSAPGLTDAERRLLRRAPGFGWTAADVPLLDEAAELLGFDDRQELARQARRRAAEVEYAQGVLDIARGSRAGEQEDPEGARSPAASDLVNAEYLAELHRLADLRSIAERAAADRTWTFGHVIVDEAQELSPMDWRVLVRRCPTRSFTIIGDMAQTGSACGPRTWQQALEPFFGDRWHVEQLTVNYRTPAEIAAASEPVLKAIDPDLRPGRAVRDGGEAPVHLRGSARTLPDRVADVTAREAERVGAGRVAVVVPAAELERLAEAVRGRVRNASWGPMADLDQKVVVLTTAQAKGLEFDSVVVADPASMLSSSPHGVNDLYVALTRSTRRLTIVHAGPIPDLLTP